MRGKLKWNLSSWLYASLPQILFPWWLQGGHGHDTELSWPYKWEKHLEVEEQQERMSPSLLPSLHCHFNPGSCNLDIKVLIYSFCPTMVPLEQWNFGKHYFRWATGWKKSLGKFIKRKNLEKRHTSLLSLCSTLPYTFSW